MYLCIEDSRILEYVEQELPGVNSNCIYLHVVQDDGITVEPLFEFKDTELNAKNGFLYTNYHNNGSAGLLVKCSVVIRDDETFWSSVWSNYFLKNDVRDDNTYTVKSLLTNMIRTRTPFKVTTDFSDIKNGMYIFTKNSSRKQTHKGVSIWDLEFKTYKPITTAVYKNNNKLVKKAIKSAKAKKVKSKTKKSKTSSALLKKFRKCKVSSLKYSKTKKVVECVKYLQRILKKKKHYTGKIDGWYGPDTKKAVQKFQKKTNKTPATSSKKLVIGKGTLITKLHENGKIDKATFNVLKKG